MARFHLSEVEKSETVYPEWNDALRASMQAEVDAFIDHVLWNENGSLDVLFTGSFSFVDENLATMYGVEMPSAGLSDDGMGRVELDPTERAGILTLPAFLAKHALPDQTSPVLRGAFVRERLFCQPLPPPPEGLVVVPPDPDPTLSTRERYVQHRADPACSGCHQLMDPIGFTLEQYDAIGRFRTVEEHGQPVDARGEITATVSADGELEGGVELAQRIAASEDLSSCVTRQWLRYALGRLEAESDDCLLARIDERFAASGYDLREIVVAIASSEAFGYRRATTDEAREVSP